MQDPNAIKIQHNIFLPPLEMHLNALLGDNDFRKFIKEKCRVAHFAMRGLIELLHLRNFLQHLYTEKEKIEYLRSIRAAVEDLSFLIEPINSDKQKIAALLTELKNQLAIIKNHHEFKTLKAVEDLLKDSHSVIESYKPGMEVKLWPRSPVANTTKKITDIKDSLESAQLPIPQGNYWFELGPSLAQIKEGSQNNYNQMMISLIDHYKKLKEDAQESKLKKYLYPLRVINLGLATCFKKLGEFRAISDLGDDKLIAAVYRLSAVIKYRLPLSIVFFALKNVIFNLQNPKNEKATALLVHLLPIYNQLCDNFGFYPANPTDKDSFADCYREDEDDTLSPDTQSQIGLLEIASILEPQQAKLMSGQTKRQLLGQLIGQLTNKPETLKNFKEGKAKLIELTAFLEQATDLTNSNATNTLAGLLDYFRDIVEENKSKDTYREVSEKIKGIIATFHIKTCKNEPAAPSPLKTLVIEKLQNLGKAHLDKITISSNREIVLALINLCTTLNYGKDQQIFQAVYTLHFTVLNEASHKLTDNKNYEKAINYLSTSLNEIYTGYCKTFGLGENEKPKKLRALTDAAPAKSADKDQNHSDEMLEAAVKLEQGNLSKKGMFSLFSKEKTTTTTTTTTTKKQKEGCDLPPINAQPPEQPYEGEYQEREYQEGEYQEREYQEGEYQEEEYQEEEYQEEEYQEEEYQEEEYQEEEYPGQEQQYQV